jgi:hypothetical protein
LGGKHQVHYGNQTYFWFDCWTGPTPLRASFPRLFEWCDNPYVTVARVETTEGWHIRFRRTFGLAKTVEWTNLYRVFDLHPISHGNDKVSWGLEASGEYLVNSLYCRLSLGAAVTHFKDVWKTRVLPKIRVFLWQLLRGRLPSGNQLVSGGVPLELRSLWGARGL